MHEPENNEPSPQDEPVRSRFSFPLGIPLVVFPVLAFFGAGSIGRPFGYVLNAAFFILVAVFARQAASSKEFNSVAQKDPSLNRLTWVLNWVLFFVLWPILLWGFLALPRLLE
jgi:hypothetical protein